jgi:hypothetical protein
MKKLELAKAGKRLVNISCLMTKGILGIIIIMLAVAATAASYLLCLPFLLFGNMKQVFKDQNH